MRVVDLARAVGISTQQVRNYEAFGLFPPVERSASGYRVYSHRHLQALRTVRAMLEAGYSQAQALEAMGSESIDAACPLIDARHAELDRQRRQIDHTLGVIESMAIENPAALPELGRVRRLRIGDAARMAGVRPSALRFWEQEGLLQPGRDRQSGYRTYDQWQLYRLEIIVLLRNASYEFEAIRSVLAELTSGRTASTLQAIEQRRQHIAAQSRACARATALLWEYLSEES
jgi:DNA-binding transcriptional MerR regulator